MNSLLKLYFFDFLFIIFLLFLYFTSCVYFVSHANFKNICNILLCTSVICQRLLSDRDCIPPLMQICCSPSVKLRITHCLLLFAIEAGDLLDLVKPCLLTYSPFFVKVKALKQRVDFSVPTFFATQPAPFRRDRLCGFYCVKKARSVSHT